MVFGLLLICNAIYFEGNILVKKNNEDLSALVVQGLNFQKNGDIAKAFTSFSSVLEAEPNNPAALYSLAFILYQSKQLEAALQLTTRGVEVINEFFQLWVLHGSILQALGKINSAIEAYNKAIQIDSNNQVALINCGVLLRVLQKNKEALSCFDRVLKFNPDNTIALGNAAIILTELKYSARAIEMFKRLLLLNPRYKYALGLLFFEKLFIGDWSEFEAIYEKIFQGIKIGHEVCKTLAFMAINDLASDQFLCARIFANDYAAVAKPMWNGEHYSHDRIRVAYVSPDFLEHPVSHLMSGVFESHDKSKFETIAISLGIDDASLIRSRIVDSFDQFIDARTIGSKDIAQIMRDMEVDIAIDLAGYTSDSKIEIFSYRPAPVHVSFLGYPGTLGVDFMDFIIADRHVIPEKDQVFYQEKVVYLPDSYLPTDNTIKISDKTPNRHDCGLPDDVFVFCCFCHSYKIHPTIWSLWMRLLDKTPNSVLWLAYRCDLSRNNFRDSAISYGIEPDRIIFAPRLKRVEDHLVRYRQADLFLDTWPYNAHTTAADSLMMGLPVLTLMGNSFPSRVGGSLLHTLGLPELITYSFAAYEEQALRLSSDRDLLQEIKGKLELSIVKSPLFDTLTFTRNLEAVFSSLLHVH